MALARMRIGLSFVNGNRLPLASREGSKTPHVFTIRVGSVLLAELLDHRFHSFGFGDGNGSEFRFHAPYIDA